MVFLIMGKAKISLIVFVGRNVFSVLCYFNVFCYFLNVTCFSANVELFGIVYLSCLNNQEEGQFLGNPIQIPHQIYLKEIHRNLL